MNRDRLPRACRTREGARAFPRLLVLTGMALTWSVLAGAAPEGETHVHDSVPVAGSDSATVHHRFENAEQWAQVFEDPGRDEWQRPDQVLAFLALDSAVLVADIGSATGYFDVRFARAAPLGKIYAVDIEPALVDYLNQRAEKEKLGNLHSILGAPDDPKLPERVDLIFVCDTYHHIDDRVAYFHRLLANLRPGGRLVVVDFKPGDLPVGPGPAHKLAQERVVAELYAAGYDLKRTDLELPYQFMLEFGPRPDLHLKAPRPPEEGGKR